MAIAGLKLPFEDGFSGFEGDLGAAFKSAIRLTSGVPETRTRSSLALGLQVVGFDGRHRIIGAGQEFSVSQQLQTEDEFEINRFGRGLPADIVQQNLTTRSIRFNRLDLYTAIFEEAFGTKEFSLLIDFKVPITLREVWREPGNFFRSTDRIYNYIGCRITSFDRTLSVEGDRLVKTAATLTWRDRKRAL